MPDILFLGGNRSNLARWRPWAGNSRPGPTWNENFRYTFQNDLSWTKGRHNMKFTRVLNSVSVCAAARRIWP